MQLSSLTAISPIDGRYRSKAKSLSPYFSEFGLIRYRVLVEIEYFIALCELPLPQLSQVPHSDFSKLRQIYKNFGIQEAKEIKDIEQTTNHDVKAVEYWLKQHFETLGLGKFKEFIHFGLTSQDVNNTAIPYSLKEAVQNEVLPMLEGTVALLNKLALDWHDQPMLARTHGQPASPTAVGKEIMVFSERITQQLKFLKSIPYAAKFGGATGNFNAHTVAYPEVDWEEFGNQFINDGLSLRRSRPTTQIEHYDHLAALLDNFKRVGTILIDLSRDMWHYISINYFTQKLKEGEVGSSAMPHKVNPIDFENAEGNIGIANALFEHLSAKLPISRLQRDLTDSTVLRNLGVPLAHLQISLLALQTGLNKLQINREAINQDLEDNWVIIAEAIQTILRREGVANPYEKLKALTRGQAKINAETFKNFINELEVSEGIKQELRKLQPHTYIGTATNWMAGNN
jgi:adenylosuccinate lyase